MLRAAVSAEDMGQRALAAGRSDFFLIKKRMLRAAVSAEDMGQRALAAGLLLYMCVLSCYRGSFSTYPPRTPPREACARARAYSRSSIATTMCVLSCYRGSFFVFFKSLYICVLSCTTAVCVCPHAPMSCARWCRGRCVYYKR
jgi:hypothetical protein